MRILLLFLCAELVLPLFGAETTSKPFSTDASSPSEGVRSTAPIHLAPGSNDWRIAVTTVYMLEHFHYLRPTVDASVSGKFFDLYINTLDPQHIHFLKSDLEEFEQYRPELGELIKRRRDTTPAYGDTTPAYVIFNRFMQRMEERLNYSKELLNTEKFAFSGNEKISLNRKESPFPQDETEARRLWRERVRYEYLQEKLNKESQGEIARIMLNQHDPFAFALTAHDFHHDIVKIITLRYNRIMRNFREWDNEKVLETYLTALAHVFDPHSDYEDKDDLTNFAIQMSLSLFGIGAVLTSEDGYCKIKELNPSGPAIKSKKFKPNDRIVAVAQGTNEAVDVVDMPLNKVVDLIRGPKGTEVRLTIIPADAVDPSTHVTISLVRDEIKLEDQQAKAKIIELPGKNGQVQRLGVIDLPSFYASFQLMNRSRGEAKSATADVERLLEKLKAENVSGVILDLRRNGGGSLEEAINLTGLFIKEGPVVQVKGPEDNDIRVDEDHDPSVQYDGPLIVLTSHFSASASEILAGALQDYGRALVVGDQSTHGKGTVQSMSQLAPQIVNWRLTSAGLDLANLNPLSFGALRYTTNKFYRVSGSSTQLKGVVPDIILPSINDYLEVGEASLENPLPWDPISKASYEKLNRVEPYLAELEKRSSNRVAASTDYAYVREDIELVKKAVAEKAVSLNEQQRLKEKEEVDAHQKAREQELKSRKLPDQKVFKITLKNNAVEMVEDKPAQTNNPALAAGSSPAAPEHLSENVKFNPSGLGTNAQSTNIVALAATVALDGDATPTDPEDPVAASEKTPQVDVNLEEAEHILMDYISLSHGEGSLTARHSLN